MLLIAIPAALWLRQLAPIRNAVEVA